MEIPVAIVTYNSAAQILPCLASIYRHSQGTIPLVSVIDNHSDDETLALVRQHFPAVHIIANMENLGYGRALNLFLEKQDSMYCFVMNPDVEFSNDVLHHLESYMRQNENAWCCGPMVIDPKGQAARAYGYFPGAGRIFFEQFFLAKLFPDLYKEKFLFDKNYAIRHMPFSVDYVSGAAMLIRSSSLKTAGYFDEDFFLYGEESELAFRMKQNGFRAIICPTARVMHREGASIKKMNADDLLLMHRESMWLYFQKTSAPGRLALLKLIYTMGDLMRLAKNPRLYRRLMKVIWSRQRIDDHEISTEVRNRRER